ncbi:RNA polymerase sigma factor [Lignipirellula cremea]|uniref:RNA polymerase sigma factor n=2 Tax=Lignipirellula cremea TaxID=2528010 RepID=A0A518DKX6_9BACT|nr:RNA polymerase sigma factor [Lignipirellula cremea]
MLLSFIHALVRDRNDAEDLFQEVGVLVLKKGAEAPQDSHRFAGWCRGIARNLVLHHWRSKQRNKLVANERLLHVLERAYEEASLEDGLPQQRSVALPDCLNELADHSRHVIQMRYFQGLTSEQIGQQLDRSAAAVRKLLSRIRAQLEQCIERRLAHGGASDE